MVQIAYKGSGPALADVVGGHVQLMVAPLAASMPMATAGKLRALAVTSRARNSAPDLPTLHESGLPGLFAEGWNGLLAPARTPAAVVAKLNSEIMAAVKHPETLKQFLAQSYEPMTNSPREFADFIRSEIEKLGNVIKAAGIRAE
jgi:tripartite-type tricarboxylate transporter receptor subunit TctC